MRRSPTALALASHVHWCEIDGVAFVLDAVEGEYFALDEEDSPTWRAVFAGANTRCSADRVEAIVASARRRNWLLSGPGDDAPGEAVRTRGRPYTWIQRRFPALSALICLSATARSLRRCGFGPTYARAQAYSGDPARAQESDSAMPRALAAFQAAERVMISRLGAEDCLPRSLALYVHLRRSGCDVRHCIGVQRYPFTAHAWVEHRGAPLLADKAYGRTPTASPAAVAGFTPLAVLD